MNLQKLSLDSVRNLDPGGAADSVPRRDRGGAASGDGGFALRVQLVADGRRLFLLRLPMTLRGHGRPFI